MKKIRRLIFIFIAIAMLVALVGCGNEEETNTRKKNSVENEVNNTKQTETPEYESDENPVATMVVEYVDESGNKEEGTIKIELYPDKAPITVANFINLANNKFYDGITFHRIVDKFMIQGGDPKGNGTGGAALSDLNKNVQKGSSEDYNYSIKGEFSKNNISNKIKFEAGTIAMARSDYSSLGLAEDGYNSACSQFFIMNTDDSRTNAYLEGNYAAFGKVIEGYDIVTKISKTKVTANGSELSKPITPPVIKSLVIDTKGKKYDIPETINADEVDKKIQETYKKLTEEN